MNKQVAQKPAEPVSSIFIRRCARWIAKRKGLIALLFAAVLGLVWLAGGLYTVQNGGTAVLKRFGDLQREGIGPGLHFCAPKPIDETQIVMTGEVHRVRIGGDISQKLEFITGDENLIDTDLVVQYS